MYINIMSWIAFSMPAFFPQYKMNLGPFLKIKQTLHMSHFEVKTSQNERHRSGPFFKREENDNV